MAIISASTARVKFRHASPTKNIPSILRHGLLTSKSQGKRKAIWLHRPSCSGWAAVHTARRHHVAIEAVCIIEVEVPRGQLRKSGKPGVWYTTEDIGPERLGAIRGIDQYATAVKIG
jgi:hypothetical protein